MKTISGIILALTLAFLTACEGVQGPPGRDGMDGEDGDSFLGSVFEIQGDFTPGNDYSLYYEFPGSFTVYESDVVLVYILWEQAEDNNGDPLDVWRLLPQTVVLDDGVLQYNYDHTFLDVQIFLEGTTDFSTLRESEALDQIFRIVVLPADFAHNNSIDVTDYNMMMKSIGANPNTIGEIEPDKAIQPDSVN